MRGAIVTLESTFQHSASLQSVDAVTKKLLGEFLAAVSLVNASIKREGTLTLQAQGKGYLRLVAAEINQHGHVRAIVRVNREISHDVKNENLRKDLKEGLLFLTLDPVSGQRYQGVVPVDAQTLSTCLRDYFIQSEQIPTIFCLYATETKCGGLLLQLLPSARVRDEEERANLWETVEHLCATLNAEEFFSVSHETLLYRLFHEQGCRVLSEDSIEFRCSCSRERSAVAIQALGREDASELLSEQGSIDIDCEFCGKRYVFTEENMGEVFPDLPN